MPSPLAASSRLAPSRSFAPTVNPSLASAQAGTKIIERRWPPIAFSKMFVNVFNAILPLRIKDMSKRPIEMKLIYLES